MGRYGQWKRALDALLSAILLMATSPLVVLALVLVKLTSRGPAIYSQARLGWNGKPFTIYKIRTMRHNCESLTGPRWCLPGDRRVTRVGHWLRRTHIDELPQLWNILKGDMALVGPRPERPEFVVQLQRSLRHYRERLSLRPGLTGLAQILQPPDTDLHSVRRKLLCDLYYVSRCSLWLDLRILMGTAWKIIGVPYRVTRICFGFPSMEHLEKLYRALVEAAGA